MTARGQDNSTTIFGLLLDAQGIVNPLTKKPFSEALLLGIGGGLGGMYFAWEMCGSVFVFVGGRHWAQDNVHYLDGLGKRLGIPLEFQQPGGKKAAQAALDALLDAGRPALAWADWASLPYHHMAPDWRKHLIRTVAVMGRDSAGRLLVRERGPVPFVVDPAALLEARLTQPYMKARLLALGTPKQAPDVPAAIRQGIQAMAEGMLHPPIKNFGLAAWTKWAQLIDHPKDKKGWPTLLREPHHLTDALKGIYESIEIHAGGGGLYRPLYGEFLREAGALLKDKALAALAKDCEALGPQWTALAELCLPDSRKSAKQIKSLLRKREEALRKGPAGQKAVAECSAKLEALRAGPYDPIDTAAFFPELRARLEVIAAAEEALVRKLASWGK